MNGAFDPANPDRFFTVSTNAVIRWDIHDPRHPVAVGAPLTSLTEPTGLVVLQVSPDGRRVAVAGFTNAETSIWDTDSGTLVAPRLSGLPGGFTPDSALLAVTRHDRVVLVDAVTGAEAG